jgi:transposase
MKPNRNHPCCEPFILRRLCRRGFALKASSTTARRPLSPCATWPVLVLARGARRTPTGFTAAIGDGSHLPLEGRQVRLVVVARRFRCDAPSCPRAIFTERFDKDVLAPWARQTLRLESVVHWLELALGGRPAASFARRLMVPVSNETLSGCSSATLSAFPSAHHRRHRRLGLEAQSALRHNHLRPRTAAANMSPAGSGSRDRASMARCPPQIAVVARDRGGSYSIAASKALPSAIQVADRWHLMENASHAFLDAVRKSMRQIRAVMGAAIVDPELLTAAERLQYEGYLRREEPTPRSSRAPKAARRSRRSCATRATAGASCDGC